MPDLLHFPPPIAPAKDPASPLADADARADALDIHQSWIVEAPAGSGKTGLLIQRYLKLLAHDSVTDPEQVLAITFTTKATAEMRERVLGQLQSAAARTVPSNPFDRATRLLAEKVLARNRELGWGLLDQPRRLNIRTIDSVCSEIASSLPILSGSGGRQAPVEDATHLYALAASRTFLKLGGPDRDLHDALSTVLLYRDGNLADCEKLLGQMLALRDQWGGLVPLDRATLDDAWLDANILPKLERALDQAICAALTQLADTIPGDVLVQLTTAAADMAVLDGYKGNESKIVVCAGRRSVPGSTADDLEHWIALKHLLIAPSTSSWRKAFGRNVIGFETGKFEQEQLKQIVRDLEDNDELLAALCKLGTLPPSRYPADQWAVARRLFRILNHALAELQFVFAERGECDFVEVALAARIALTSADGPHDLEAALGVRLQHLLVDEMQDTSASQYELIQTLTRNWDGHSQTVFLVGDPKQSIYLFRHARVERFLRTMRSGQLGDLPVGTLRLTANFRSQAALVDDFNADFSTIFPPASNSLHPEEVPYVHAISARVEIVQPTQATPKKTPPKAKLSLNYSLFDDDPDPDSTNLGAPSIAASRNGWGHTGTPLALAATAATPRVWHTTVHPFERDRIERARATRAQRLADAAEVCRIVEDWRSRPLPNGRTAEWKIAVLCRSRNHLQEIVAALKAAAIPSRAVEIDPLKDRPEVRDLIALTRALLHPADRVAWLAILRAPWCGLSLADLYTLTGADDPAWAERSMQQVVAERGHLLSGDACQRLERIWPALETAVDSRARLSLAQLVERTWRSLGGASWLDASALINATRYLQLLDRIESEQTSGAFELSLLDRRLEKLFAAPAIHPAAVDILTIHRAKGLEWDVVIVPALERIPPPQRPRLLNWVQLDSADEDSAHVLLAPIAGKGEASHNLTKWIGGIHSAREAAERKRLFYVACTRAREELHLFAAPTYSAEGNIKPMRTSLLAAAWPAAESRFTAEAGNQAFAIAASADPDTIEIHGEGAESLEDTPDTEPFAASPDVSDSNAIETQLSLRVANRTAPLKRLPATFDPAAQFLNDHPIGHVDSPKASVKAPQARPFERPEGSITARAFGNAVHAFLEQVTLRLAANEPHARLIAGLRGWLPRIAAVLRSEGLQPAAVERLGLHVVHALESALKDPTGRWLLSPHTGAATEYALTAWTSQRSTIRIDRIFRAGEEPLSTGSDHLWIIDYKTTTYGTEGREEFLAAEKIKYAPQLEAYAAVLSQSNADSKIRLALYYPLLAQIIWWPYQE